MDYYINPAELTSSVPVPSTVADRYLKLAKAEHIKVLLYIFRKMTVEMPVSEISEQTNVSEYDVKEALLYWADTGILIPKEMPSVKTEEKEVKTVARIEKPSRADVARRGNEDAKISYLLRETQLKLGRNLKSNEASTLVWLYDDQGLDVSLILLIVQYAATHNKANMRFIEATAVDWINKGIDSITAADEELRRLSMGEQAWSIVCSAFGIERRKPSRKETELSFKWIDNWKLSKEILTEAYEECVNTKSKFSFAYTAKIIENWHEKGIKTLEDLKDSNKKRNKADFAAYDLDLYEKMLNSKD